MRFFLARGSVAFHQVCIWYCIPHCFHAKTGFGRWIDWNHDTSVLVIFFKIPRCCQRFLCRWFSLRLRAATATAAVRCRRTSTSTTSVRFGRSSLHLLHQSQIVIIRIEWHETVHRTEYTEPVCVLAFHRIFSALLAKFVRRVNLTPHRRICLRLLQWIGIALRLRSYFVLIHSHALKAGINVLAKEIDIRLQPLFAGCVVRFF